MSLSVGDIFEEYVESLTNLPSEMDQNMHELRSMDEEFQRHREVYIKHKRSYFKLLRNSNLTVCTNSSSTSSPTTPSPSTHLAHSRSQLDKDYATAMQKQDQKIELAMRMYELVSRHIERIDSQMAQNNLSALMTANTGTGTAAAAAAGSSGSGTTTTMAASGQQAWLQPSHRNHSSQRHYAPSSMSSSYRSSSTHYVNGSTSNANNYSGLPGNGSVSASTVIGISRKSPHWDEWRGDGSRKRSLLQTANGPRKRTHHSTRPNPAMATGALMEHDIDPNEPRYCYCNQVSFGDMVACDGDSCEKEWFHYACVGLTEPPAGKWFCDDCAVEEHNQKRAKRYN